MGKVTVYGSNYCPGTQAALQLMDEKKIIYEFKNISGELVNLKEFLHIRDTDEQFNTIHAEGRIGIPCFVLENGAVSLNVNDIFEK
ncbi:MAG: hypothetical protein IJ056_05670 [Acidaminococcaceae bacterium]|nr:hypothetical protein [Acidaminococcaceae bacterium]MBR1591176.1 hypothetical protein [Acidaminococcaceae bacterium]